MGSNYCDKMNYCTTNTYKQFAFRPRGALARAMYQKQETDRYLDNLDKNKWYQCELDLISPSLSSKFVQLEPDKESLKFIKESENKSDRIFTQIWHLLAKYILSWFMTQTSINGWLRRGSMFVLSLPQFLKLLNSDGDWHRQSLMDLGAGDGAVTAHLSPLFEKVYVTEVSGVMKNILMMRGYEVLDVQYWDVDKKYDVVACLNLIDRCNTPFQLLDQVRKSLKPDGLVLLALVLPFSAYVEIGSKNHKPEELLPVVGITFEEQVESTVKDVLEPSGFEVVAWSRVPYLCEGDLKQSFYWLDDVIFVLRRSTANETMGKKNE